MSVEGGTMSGGISGGASMGASVGASAPSFGGEAPSISSPLSGGSVFEGISAGGMFSETSAFAPTVSVMPETFVSKSVDVFSPDFKTIGYQAPKLEIPGFKEFSPTQSIPEKSVTGLNLGELTVVAKPAIKESIQVSDSLKVATEASIEPKLGIPGFREFTPSAQTVPETLVVDFNPKEFTVFAAATGKTPATTETQNQTETLKYTDQNQAERVALLLESAGLYTKNESKAVVSNILNEKLQGKVEAVNAEPKTQTQTQVAEKVAVILKELEDIEEEDEEEEKKKTLLHQEQNSKNLYVEVDEQAQENRKSSIRYRIGELFKIARNKNSNSILGKDVVAGLVEKIEHKSQLLKAEGYEKFPDGSFHEQKDDIAVLTSKDASFNAEDSMYSDAVAIIDNKPGVRVTEKPSTKPVFTKDVDRVKKFVNSPLSALI